MFFFLILIISFISRPAYNELSPSSDYAQQRYRLGTERTISRKAPEKTHIPVGNTAAEKGSFYESGVCLEVFLFCLPESLQ